MFILVVVAIKNCFPFQFGTDDDHRVVMKSISGGVDCEHDYINAAYIDVSFLHANTYGEVMYTGLTNSAPLHLTLRAIPKASGTLLPKVSYIQALH